MFRLALRNIFRHKMRTTLTLAGIMSGAIGLILTGGFIEDALLQLREATIHSQLGHLQIYRAGYYAHGSQAPYRYAIEQPAEVLRLVTSLPQVHDAMERLNFSGVLSNGRTDIPILGEGLQPDKEAMLGGMVTIIAGRQLSDKDTNGIELGDGVATASELRPGDRATLLANTASGALNTRDFEVVGVFRSFSKDYDSRTVRIPLAAAQELLDTKWVNAIVLALRKTALTSEVGAILAGKLDSRVYEVKTWEQLAEFYDQTEALYRRQFAVLQVIILIAVLLSVANSVNMTIFERTSEFGTLMALGNTSKVVFRLVVTENLLLGLIGSGMGALLGMLLASGISAIGIPMPAPPNSNSGYTAHIRIVLSVIVSAFFVGFLATIGAALLPARKVARLPIIDALRQSP